MTETRCCSSRRVRRGRTYPFVVYTGTAICTGALSLSFVSEMVYTLRVSAALGATAEALYTVKGTCAD